MRTLTGIQATGTIHWGNYFGVVEPALEVSRQPDNDAICLIANMHALTSAPPAKRLQQWTFDLAIDLVALGLDPNQATLYVQSSVPETMTLAWLLSTVADLEILSEGSSYREKQSEGMRPTAALLSYPVLMAADIAATGAERVVVGADQHKHLEVCRALLERFNRVYGEALVVPRAEPLTGAIRVPGTDGVGKMSKNTGNTIDVLSDPAGVREHLGRIAEGPEGGKLLLELYRLFVEPSRFDEMQAAFAGGRATLEGIAHALADAVQARFEQARARRRALAENPALVEQILSHGARRVRPIARGVLGRALSAAGVSTTGLREEWDQASTQSTFDSVPAIDGLREPTRTRAAEHFEELRAEGVETPAAVEQALAMALEWEMSRAPTLAIPDQK